MPTPEQAEFAAHNDDVDRLLLAIGTALGGASAFAYDLERAVAHREAARIRTMPGFPNLVLPEECADHIDPAMRHRAQQEPMTVHAMKPPTMAVFLQLQNGSSYSMDVRPGGCHDRIDTLSLSPDDKVTIQYGHQAGPGEELAPQTTPARSRLLAHITVRRFAECIRQSHIRSYPWEDLT